MNNTVGEIEPLQSSHYILGVILLLSFLTVSVLNILLLMSFYNLRHLPFVRNAKTVISLVVTDLVNALLLIPTLLSWFLLSPRNSYGVCVFKSFPFMLSNFTSLLSMTVFCVHRLTVIKKIAVGELKVRTKHIGMATMLLWLMAILVMSVPYIVWNNSGLVLMNCRRVLFSNIQLSLVYFTVMFDIPLVIMNGTLVVLFVIWVKYKARVCVVQAGIKHETVCDRNDRQNDQSSRIKTFSFGSQPSGGMFDDVDKSVASALADIQIETNNDFKRHLGTVCVFDALTELSGGSDSHTAAYDWSIATRSWSEIGQPCHASNFELLNKKRCTPVPGESNVSDLNFTQTNGGYVHATTETSVDKNDTHDTGLQNERTGETLCKRNRTSQPFAKLGKISYSEMIPTDVEEQRDERGLLANDLKQFLVTMGVLVAVYDITVLPLLLDLTIGGAMPDFTIPHALNSLCFLNSLCNPIVYLIRMRKVRLELKRIATSCWCKNSVHVP